MRPAVSLSAKLLWRRNHRNWRRQEREEDLREKKELRNKAKPQGKEEEEKKVAETAHG